MECKCAGFYLSNDAVNVSQSNMIPGQPSAQDFRLQLKSLISHAGAKQMLTCIVDTSLRKLGK